jgi:hypothetical protein
MRPTVIAVVALLLAGCSGSDATPHAVAREVWRTSRYEPENVTGPALDQDSGTRIASAFWWEGPAGLIVAASHPFCGLTLEIEGVAPMRPSVSTPREVLIYARDGTAGMTRSGDLTWSRPANWPTGNHWAPASDQSLYAVAVSLLLAGTDRGDHALVDVIDLDVIPCG